MGVRDKGQACRGGGKGRGWERGRCGYTGAIQGILVMERQYLDCGI